MERAVFILERDSSRIPCLLNPENLTIQRTSGVRVRGSSSGPMVLKGGNHDPLLYTDGGKTELTLDLLFDVSLVASASAAATPDTVQTTSPEDVRDLTRPLMALAENNTRDTEQPVPLVRFVWGKAWNMLGVVVAAAERLEYFSEAGVPQRSWFRMRFVVVPEPDTAESDDGAADSELPIKLDPDIEMDTDEIETHHVLSDGNDIDDDDDEVDVSSERLDEIATRCYGDPSLWRLIAEFNDIDDPMGKLAGRSLRIPPKSVGGPIA